MSVKTMNRIPRIPLSDRLKTTRGSDTLYPSIFLFFLDDYFNALLRISGDDYFRYICENEIGDIYETLPCMADFVTGMEKFELPEKQELSLLYHTLIEPFVMIQDMDIERSLVNNE